MKNRLILSNSPVQESKQLNWLYNDASEEDFLLGKTHGTVPEIWEDEEE